MENEEQKTRLRDLLNDEETLKNLDAFVRMNLLYEAAMKVMNAKLEILQREYSMAHGYNPIHSVESRLKTPKSIAEKLWRKNLPLSIEAVRRNLKDVAGMRIICNYKNDVYTIADVLKRHLDLSVVEEKDYIANPKENGYRSYHLVLTVPVYFSNATETVPIEIQIRTIAMDFWASLEHKLRYKKDGKMSYDLQQRLKASAEITDKLDEEMQNINLAINDLE